MNQPPHLPTPPDGFDVDEALTALIDGELDGFARDHGTTEAAVREQLASDPRLDERRRALLAARAAIAEPEPPLDDLTRHRLVRDAVRAAPTPASGDPRRRWSPWIAAAAVALVVVIGVGLAIAAFGNDSSTSSSSTGSSRVANPLRGNVGDLGDVTSTAALRALLNGRAEAAKRRVPHTVPLQNGSADSGAALAPAAGATVSPAACARELSGRAPTFSGTATFRGVPALVLGVDKGGRTIVFVVGRSDCTNVVASISR
jgi:hypothetical protein